MGFAKSEHVERWLTSVRANFKYRDTIQIKVLDGWLNRPEILDRIGRKRGRRMSDKQSLFQSIRALKTVLKDRFDGISPEMKPADKQELAKLSDYIHHKCRQLCGEFSHSSH